MLWLEPWWSIAEQGREFAETFELALYREVGFDHPLNGMRVEAIARHNACDDVLFLLLDGSDRVAVVHLTWTSHPPENPPWPVTEIYPNLQTWADERMRSDHDEYHN